MRERTRERDHRDVSMRFTGTWLIPQPIKGLCECINLNRLCERLAFLYGAFNVSKYRLSYHGLTIYNMTCTRASSACSSAQRRSQTSTHVQSQREGSDSF